MYKSPFEKALRRFTEEADWVCGCFSETFAGPQWVHSGFAQEMMLIRLHDAWARFCREVVVVSAYGKVDTLAGVRLNTSLPAIKSRSQVIPVFLTLNNGNFPKWFDSGECIKTARKLQIGNFNTFANAIGASNSPADTLREIRNFYAHRGKGTAGKANAVHAFTGRKKPDIAQLNTYTQGGVTVLESWSSVLISIATAAVQ